MDPYLGQIMLFAGNFAPRGWALCNGQLLSISQYSALFAILGTTYGGNGQTTFALPNLQSRVPLHWGQGTGLSQYTIGQVTGVENVTLLQPQMPAHTHTMVASTTVATQTSPANNILAVSVDSAAGGSPSNFIAAPGNTTMAPGAITPTGGNQPHTNIQPVLALTFCIATVGVYPTRN